MTGQPPKKRSRLDALLVERGLAPDAPAATRLIMAGKVVVDDHRVDKPGTAVRSDAAIHLKGSRSDGWASRGAFKLLGALDAFAELRPALDGALCLDIGASTGGFTDVLLRNGASHVVALDVGYGQIIWRLRNDPRVTVLDRTNIRLLDPKILPYRPMVVSCDASFIRLGAFVDVVAQVIEPGGFFVVLVKPQFEAPKEDIGPGGVITDEAVRQTTLTAAKLRASQAGFEVLGAVDSPVAGPQGNREFLLLLRSPVASKLSANAETTLA